MSKSEVEGDANDIVRKNPGTAMRFGKTAVVCGLVGGGTGTVKNGDFCAFIASMGKVCGIDGNVYYCDFVDNKYKKDVDCDNGCFVRDGSATCGLQLQCTVKAFELPQYVKISDGELPWLVNVALKPIDWGRAWIGATGDPTFLVYYERFPEEAESWWTYGVESKVATVFATGAFLSIAPTGLKLLAAPVKPIVTTGGKSLKALILRKATTSSSKMLLRQEMKMALKASLAKEFGGEFIEKYARAVAIEQGMVGDVAREALNDAIVKKMADPADGISMAALRNNKAALSDLAHGVKGDGYIEREYVVSVLEKHGMSDLSADNVLIEVNRFKSKADVGDLIQAGDLRTSMQDVITRRGYSSAGEYTYVFAENFKTKRLVIEGGIKTDNKIVGAIPGVRWAVEKLKKRSVEKAMLEYDSTALASLQRIESAFAKSGDDFSGDLVAGMTKSQLENLDKELIAQNVLNQQELDILTNPAKAELDSIVAAWYAAEGDIGIKTTILQRSSNMLRGFTGLPPQGWPTWKRAAVLAGIYGGAAYFMKEESKAEKYYVNENSITLYYPKMWAFILGDDPSEGNYKVNSEIANVKTDTFVQLKIPEVLNDGGIPLALASPCKSDIKVTYGEDCECKEYISNKEVSVNFFTKKCMAGANLICPPWGALDGEGNVIDKDNYETWCPSKILIDQDETNKYSITQTHTLDTVLLEIQCEAGDSNACKTLHPEYGKSYAWPTRCPYNYAIRNLGPAKEEGMKPYKICTESGFISQITEDPVNTNCIKIEVDTNSMIDYMDASNMDKNFCRINDATTWDYGMWVAEVGVAVGSIAVSILATPLAGEAVGFFGGGLTAVGWKLAEEAKVWPNNQY